MRAQAGSTCRSQANTAYVNTIPADQEEELSPGNIEIEERLRAYMRWNAMAMVVKANRLQPADGGDLAVIIGSFASLATMFGAGFNHFWHAESEGHGGDLLSYIQGHSAPGVYARAYPGRPPDRGAAAELPPGGRRGLSSYPHPKLMPEFWQFPTVSMGLGPADGDLPGALPEVPACARHRRHQQPQGLGVLRRRRDGRAGIAGRDHPGAREKLDNLIFVINCNLQRPGRPGARQRQDHPGAGGRVPRRRLERHQAAVGQRWDRCWRARQGRHRLRKLMMDVVDGDYQAMKANDGAFVRKHFFGRDPRTLEMVAG